MGKKIGLAVVALVAVGIVAVKARSGSSRTPAPAVVGAVQRAPAAATGPSVVMIADPREADVECACGEIIRRVRAAKTRGVAVDEFAADNADAARRYGVSVVPTVVFLDASGKVLARHEGESSAILAAITADLAKLEGARR